MRSKRVSLERSISTPVTSPTRREAPKPTPRLKVRTGTSAATGPVGNKGPGQQEKFQEHIPRATGRSHCPGEGVLPSIVDKGGDKLAKDLLTSIQSLQKGQAAPFYSIMSQAMANSAEGYSANLAKKAESMPDISNNNPVWDNVKSEFPMGKKVGTVTIEPQPGSSRKNSIGIAKYNKLDVVTGSSRGKKAEDKEEGQISDSDSSPDRRSGKKKLKSGILTNPDEAGIKCVVQFPHTKLDPVHVQERVFNELPFHFLVAGELEIILQDSIKNEERSARLNFLKLLCYHKQYLDIEDIRTQYVANLQAIEKGEADWTDFRRLCNQMHTNLTFHVTLKSRDKVCTELKTDKVPKLKKEGGGPKPVYCAEYNKGSCPFSDHHEGNFNKKTVTKWHICRRCLQLDGHPRRSHPESDPNCPSRI